MITHAACGAAQSSVMLMMRYNDAQSITHMRTTVDLSELLLRNAKKRAAQRGVTLSVVVEDALRQSLSARVPETSAEFKLVTVKGKLVRPDVDLDRTSALLLEDDAQAFRSKRR
jgi:hypothetical protein